jgi:hypothetical protein
MFAASMISSLRFAIRCRSDPKRRTCSRRLDLRGVRVREGLNHELSITWRVNNVKRYAQVAMLGGKPSSPWDFPVADANAAGNIGPQIMTYARATT